MIAETSPGVWIQVEPGTRRLQGGFVSERTRS